MLYCIFINRNIKGASPNTTLSDAGESDTWSDRKEDNKGRKKVPRGAVEYGRGRGWSRGVRPLSRSER